MTVLVGYTGFVGSNIYEASQGQITRVYNSKNIQEAYGTNPDMLIYAGLRAEKYLANNAPEKDMELIEQAKKNIQKINPKNLVLISTIDVFKVPKNVDENSDIDTVGLHAYGYNRYQLELWTRKEYPDALIIRLPGLFGKNIKKNFIYDIIKEIPFMIKADKFQELIKKDDQLLKYYDLQDNDFYMVKELEDVEERNLKRILNNIGFSALNFTDSRSIYQFYDLSRLWGDIQNCLRHGIRLWHPATEPVSAGELYEFLAGEKFVNELSGKPADYAYKTIHAEIFGGYGGYICSKLQVMEQIKEFVVQCKRF